MTRTAVEVTLAKPAPTDSQWRTMAQDVAHSTEKAQRLIEALLVLARSEQRVTDLEDDDLADITAEALDRVTTRARAHGLRLVTDLAPAPLRGNLALLDIAVTNLLENAVKYNTDGGLLQVTTRRPEAGAWAELTVLNDGPPLAAGTVYQLFEPFHRGEHTRLTATAPTPDGAGLGLSIVRAVTQAHHGRLRALARPEGGLAVTIQLPAAGPESSH